MSDQNTVLFANEAFYWAFADRDAEAMDAVWSDTESISCIHPGWGPLLGKEVVMQSWFAIMRNPDSPQIMCHDPRAQVYGDAASVLCFEEISGNYLIATNLFVRSGRLWKMIHHQAGPTSALPEPETVAASGPVN